MKLTLLAAVLLSLLSPWQLLAQTGAPSPTSPPFRLVGIGVEPDVPPFGDAFLLQLTVRVPPGDLIFLPDTLFPSENAASLGEGSWTTVSAPVDSVDVRATYPVVAFREGQVALPNLEVWIVRAGAPEAGRATAARSVTELGIDPGQQAEGHLLRPGLVEVGYLIPRDDSVAAVEPRPPLDVLGGQWNALMLLAAGLFLTLGISAAGLLMQGRRSTEAVRPDSGEPRPPPREEALRELDRIRLLGWHESGRMVDFYCHSSDALRHFAERVEADWPAALTSSELVREVRRTAGAGSETVERLASAMTAAESVKFGRCPPDDVSTAEAHWQAIRDWVQDYSGPARVTPGL